MVKQLGIMALVVLAMGILACAPTRQIVKIEPGMATPPPQLTPSVSMAITATPTVAPAVLPTAAPLPAVPAKRIPGGATRARVHPKPAPANVPQSRTGEETNASVSAMMAANAGPVPENPISPEAAVVSWTPTPISENPLAENSGEAKRQAGQNTPGLSITRLFMGVGLFILFGGIVYFIRQVQEKRRVTKATSSGHSETAENSRSVSAKGGDGLSLNRTMDRADEATAPVPEHHAAKVNDSGRVPEAAKIPRRRKTSGLSKGTETGTPRKTKKAALRAVRPAVKTIRLSKNTTRRF
jgi:hypothetical protein